MFKSVSPERDVCVVKETREKLRDVSEKATPKVEASCASRAIAHTHVVVLGRTTSRDVWAVVRCAVGEGQRWSAPRSIFLYLDTHWAIELYNRFRVLRVVALRLVAFWLKSVHIFASRVSTYTHVSCCQLLKLLSPKTSLSSSRVTRLY
jgi:hypothetical protein